MQRVELACHTGYSRMNGIGFADDWIKFAKENNIHTLVITDIGNIDGYADFQNHIRWSDADIKLIMGSDIRVFDDRSINGKAATTGRLTVLIKNAIGRKNLYKVLSEGEMRYKNGSGEPQIPLSMLLENREGLLIGSGSEDGILIGAEDYDKGNYDFLDYIELPTIDISSADFDGLLELADYHKIPAVAVDSPHYISDDANDAYRILKNIDWFDFKGYHSTETLLSHYELLGDEKAYEIVVKNSNMIADMCEVVPAFEDRKVAPLVENQDDILRNICEKALPLKYSEITSEIRQRLEWELGAIKTSGSAFMFIQIKDVFAKPECFDDLVRLSSLLHGTDTWLGNADVLISKGLTSISEVLASRNDIYDALIEYGIDEDMAYLVTEDVRKGKVSRGKSSRWPEQRAVLLEHGVPDWIVWSCEKICYMFPRAHAYSYVMSAWRMAWYKLHYPLEFYTVMLNVSHDTGFDPRYMAHGKDKFKTFMHFIKSEYASERPFVANARKTGILLDDYYEHGFEFKISDESRTDGEMFHIVDEHTIEIDGTKVIRNTSDYDDDEEGYYF